MVCKITDARFKWVKGSDGEMYPHVLFHVHFRNKQGDQLFSIKGWRLGWGRIMPPTIRSGRGAWVDVFFDHQYLLDHLKEVILEKHVAGWFEKWPQIATPDNLEFVGMAQPAETVNVGSTV